MRQHVIYLVPDLYDTPGGIARYCRLVCRVLSQIEQRPTVISLNDAKSSMRQAVQLFPRLHYIPCSRSHLRFLIQALWTLFERPKVIIVGHPNFAHLGWILARLSGAKLTVFMYGIDAWTPLPLIRRFGLRRADHWVAISQFTAQRAAAANGLPGNRIRILHNCFDPELKTIHTKTWHNTQRSILTVARMSLAEQYKGHDQVIRAMPALLRQFPDLVYQIVGDGDGRAAIEALAQAEGVAQAVQFQGTVSDEELAQSYAEADIFVMPSRAEGFGFVFLEAMAYGKPVVAGNVDATVEVVRHGKTGLLVNPCSTTEITAAIMLLLSDNELRYQMGSAAKAVVATDFSFEGFRDTLLGYLR
jgi:glycosyltransferase involved in cell wall biosynthesis